MSIIPQTPNRRSWSRLGLAAAATFGLTAGLLAATSPAGAQAGCEVDYTIANDWGSGYTADVTVTNLGEQVDGWTLEWDFPGDQQISNLWNGSWSQSGQSVSVSDTGWNSSIGTAGFGFNADYTGSNEIPGTFTLNGVVCDGGTGNGDGDDGNGGDDDNGNGDDNGDDGGVVPGERVANPYAGAQLYVNPEWSAQAAANGGEAVADQPTGVWLDRRLAIHEGSAGENTMGLEAHLDEALDQGADAIQVVIYNLPGRDCAALASSGELGPDELDVYEEEYIDPIVEIMDQAKYSDLRIITVIEIDSLPNLITNVGDRDTATDRCDEMLANGGYVNGVGYALGRLGSLDNVYNYVDIGHHGWLGWDDNFGPFVDLAYEAATSNGASPEDVHGFAANVANYSPTEEPHFDVGDTFNGQMIRQSEWIDWNDYADEVSYSQAYQQAMSQRFGHEVGMIIDTSRNGWGGPDRPTGPATGASSVDEFVDNSRVDRRPNKGNWCNQAGAGLGERFTVAPEPGIHAYTWIKPPGESDGSSEEIENDEGKAFDEMCDPSYEGNVRNGNSPSGALPDAPVSGHWFQAQFEELVANAHPPLD